MSFFYAASIRDVQRYTLGNVVAIIKVGSMQMVSYRNHNPYYLGLVKYMYGFRVTKLKTPEETKQYYKNLNR